MIKSTCPHDPTKTSGPIGMYHCPDCGEMQIAGFAHAGIMEQQDWDDFDRRLNNMDELESFTDD